MPQNIINDRKTARARNLSVFIFSLLAPFRIEYLCGDCLFMKFQAQMACDLKARREINKRERKRDRKIAKNGCFTASLTEVSVYLPRIVSERLNFKVIWCTTRNS